MALTFNPISSPGATRDLFVDLAGALEAGEALTQVNITSTYPTVLAVSNVAINSEIVQFEQQQTDVAQGVHFTIETLQESLATVPLVVSFQGNSGTVDKYEIGQPVVAALCR